MVPTLMQRLYGSDDLFPDERIYAYHPYQSVNYITSHDGFTLYDLVSYKQKRNWANGRNNTDGMVENYSWNCGCEGDRGVPAEVLQLRKRQVKAPKVYLTDPGLVHTLLGISTRAELEKIAALVLRHNLLVITDEVYKVDAQEFSSVGNIQTAYYGDPRTWQMIVGYRF